MAALNPAAQGLQAEMHYVDVQTVESRRIVVVNAYFSWVKAELVKEQVVECCLKAFEERNVLSSEISQGVEFGIAEQCHEMQFFELGQVSILEVRHHQKIFIFTQHPLCFRVPLDDIVDPLYMRKLLLQNILPPCCVFLSTLIMYLHLLAPVLVLMLLIDGVNKLNVDIRGDCCCESMVDVVDECNLRVLKMQGSGVDQFRSEDGDSFALLAFYSAEQVKDLLCFVGREDLGEGEVLKVLHC